MRGCTTLRTITARARRRSVKGQSAAWGRLHAWRAVGARAWGRVGVWDLGGGWRGKCPAPPVPQSPAAARHHPSVQRSRQVPSRALRACHLRRQRALGAALGAGRGWARDWRRSGSTCRCCGWTARWRRRSCHVCKGWMSPRRCRHHLQRHAGLGRSARARRRPGAPPDARGTLRAHWKAALPPGQPGTTTGSHLCASASKNAKGNYEGVFTVSYEMPAGSLYQLGDRVLGAREGG